MATNHADGRTRKPRKLSGLRTLRTAVRSRLRSKPMAEGQEYLELYVLTREQGRWGRLAEHCAEALEGIETDLGKMRTALLGGTTAQGQDDAPQAASERRGKDLGMFALK